MEGSLKKNAVSGMAWTGAEKIVNQGMQFVISVAIARVLMPEDYGIVGMLSIFMAIAQTFLDSGFGNALIQKKDRTDIDYSTTFYFNIVVSLILYTLFYFAAPLIANFYKQPLLTPITRVVSLNLVINSLGMVHATRLFADMRFKTRSMISVLSVFVTGAVGISMAYSGFGVWALVFQNLSGSLLNTIALWIVSRWKPLPMFSRKSFRQLFSFGSKLLGSSLINTIYNNLYTMVIGKAFNATEVGHYNRATSLASLPSNIATSMIISVYYPILAQLQDNDDKLISAYKKLLRVPLFVLYPCVVGMAIVAEPLVFVLLGEKWLPCVPYMQVLCLGSLFWPLTHINLNLLYVKGRSDLVLKLELIKKPIGFALLFATIPFGIWWMCAGKAVYDFIAFSFNCYYTKKILGYGEKEQLKELLPVFINCIVMATLVLLSTYWIGTNWLRLLVGVGVGVCSYAIFSILTKDSSLFELIDIIRGKFLK